MRGLLAVSIFIVLVAVAMPNMLMRYVAPRAPAPSSAAASETPPEEPESRSGDGREVEIDAESDGHFYVDASINLRPVHLMVDTGATVVALRASDAAAAGIRVRDSDYINPVQTANGMTKAAEATLESVAVSDIELRNVRALIVPDDQLSISLLGGSFLHGLRRFEVENGTLIFEN